MENRELREEIEELEICESFDMQEPRRSERSTKGIPPRRFGFASSRHSSSESSTRRRRLQAELEYKQRKAEIQQRLAEEETQRQRRLAEEEAQRQRQLAEEETQRQRRLAEEEAHRQRQLAEEEAERQLGLAAAEKELREAELDEEEELYREKTLEEVEKWIEKSAQDQDVIDGRNSREVDDCKAAENFASFGTDSVLPVSKVSTHTTSTPVSQSTACVQTTSLDGTVAPIYTAATTSVPRNLTSFNPTYMTAEPPNTHASSSLSRLLQVSQTSPTLVLPPKPFTYITTTSTANHGPNVSQSTAQQSLRTQQFQVLPTSLPHTVLPKQHTVPSTSIQTSSTRQSSQTGAQRTTVNPQIPTQQPLPTQTYTPPSVHETSSNADDAITRLANVLSGGLQLRPPQSTEQQHLSTLMARQSQGNNLPTFSGSPEEWPVFKSLYDSSTISCGFKNTENLARLQRCLKGEAKNMVQSLLSVPDNVPAIIRTLEMRYGRPDIIIRALVAKVTALPPISDNRLSDLLDFAAAVQNLVTTIKSVNAQAHLNNPSLMTELVTRLPSSLRLPWGNKLHNSDQPR